MRPAVTLLDSGDDNFVAAPVTSQARASAYDFELREWRSAGLNVPSWVRGHKLTVLSKQAVVRRIGLLSRSDRDGLAALLQQAFQV